MSLVSEIQLLQYPPKYVMNLTTYKLGYSDFKSRPIYKSSLLCHF